MPDNGQRLERTGDQETDEILGEIEREGSLGTISENEEEPISSQERAEDAEDEELGDEEEALSEEDEADETTSESGDETEDGEEDESLEDSSSDHRTSESPSQYEQRREEYWKNKAKKLDVQLAELSKKQSQTDLQEKLKDLAAKEGIPLERLSTIADVISESVTSKLMSPEQKTKLDRAFEYATREAESERQDSLFEQEFRETVLPLVQANGDDVDEMYQTLYQEAFAPKKENEYDAQTGRPARSLVQIYVGVTPRQIRRSGESSRIRSGGRQIEKPISQMSAEEIDNMSDEQFDKMSDEAALMSPNLVRPNKRTL